MRWWRSVRLFVTANRRGLLVFAAVLFGFYVFINASFLVVSTNDQTCLACHYMTPFHRTWEQSSHASVTCVKCHELGFNYFTGALMKTAVGQYNSRPLAEVRNETCLQSGCHEMAVVERTTDFRQKIAFDHKSHLGSLRRGEKLWCTSCHSSDSGGNSHFTTHEETCYICHFKGAEQGKSVTDCATCHTAPAAEVEHGGFRFNHQAYVTLGVGCDECHTRITRGDAAVDPNRCRDCHIERLEKFDDFQEVHTTHVAERGVSCFRCHSEIEHRSMEFVKTLDVTCDNCHLQLHSSQKQMYMGVGGRGLSDVPSRMFAAKVTCEGCHNGRIPTAAPHVETGGVAFPGVRSPASYDSKRESCVRCHGEGFDLMLDDWTREIKVALDHVTPYEQSARSTLASLDISLPRARQAAEFFEDALANIELAREGIGSHNVDYAVRLIDTSIDQIELAFRRLEKPFQRQSPPLVLRKPDGYCMALCHKKLDTHGIEYYAEMEIDFDHSSHGHVSCTTCHSAQKHKQRVISKGECMSCHHSEEGQEEYGVGCADCHSNEAGFYEGVVRVEGVDIEPDIMALADTSCNDCHQVKREGETLKHILGRCNDCHRDYEVEPYPVDTEFLDLEVATRRRSDSLIVRLEQQRLAIERQRRDGADVNEMREMYDSAERALNVVVKGRPHHNFVAAVAILDKVEEQLGRLKILTSE